MSEQPQAFSLHVADAAIADLRQRLSRTRFPDQPPGEPWAYGTDLAYMRSLVEHWQDRFDWRAQEARLNALPQYKVRLQGIDLHFLHVPGNGPDPHPLLLSHGWPGSVLEFLELIPRLTDPARFGEIRLMPSRSWRHPFPAMDCPSPQAKRGSGLRPLRTALLS